jgi:hypothetical protein
MRAQRLRILDDSTGIFIRQQRYAQTLRISCLGICQDGQGCEAGDQATAFHANTSS